MFKIVALTLLTSLNTLASDGFSPSEYEYIYKDDNSQKVHILLHNEIELEFTRAKEECVRSVDTCYLDFDNHKNPDYQLYGMDPCFSQNCKDGPLNISNYQVILRRRPQ